MGARSIAVLVALALSACEPKGGTIIAEISMPPPSQPAARGGQGPTAGIMLDPARDDVCTEAHVYLYRGRAVALDVSSVPAGVAPVMRGRAAGKYTADKTKCTVALAGLEPANDYWLVVRLPANLYNLQSAAPAGAFAVTGGLHPIVVREGKDTRGVLSIELRPQVKDIEPPGSPR